MIKYNKTKKLGKITSVDMSGLHGYNILCPYCYKEVDPCVDFYNWLYFEILNRKETDYISLPCGCSLPIKDLCERGIYVDEIIASPVSRINRAGYKTKYSCSGHMSYSNYAGYLLFENDYQDLLDYLTHDHYLLNILDVEVDRRYSDGEIMKVYVYRPETKDWECIDNTVFPDKDAPFDRICVRMKEQNKKRSRLEHILLFRKALIRIAKWCKKTKLYNEENRVINELLATAKSWNEL